MNSLNPDFVRNFELDYLFEEQQYLKLRVFDSDNGRPDINSSDFIGEAQCTLGEIIGSKGQQLIRTIKPNPNAKSTGNIILRCEQVNENNDVIMLQITGKELEVHSGIFHSFKPFFYLSRVMESGGNQRVYMSEHLGGKAAAWKMVEKSMKDLCNGDPTRPIIFELYDNHRSGNHDFIAATDFTIQKITEAGVKQFELINPKKKSKKGYKHSGIITINSCQIVKNYSLFDYIRGGCQISLAIAVDFTGSNGIPTSPQSLHYLSPNGYNQYEQALFAVSEILLNYDSDKQVPLYGFGAKINGGVSHCFNMNFNPADPSVCGIQGIMSAYRNSLMYAELSGPTLFGHVLAKVITEIESQRVDQFNQQYTVLLILTDGDIHDMTETIDWIVRGSNSPLSIVIVGIGNDSFNAMKKLDADETPLIDSKGKKMLRDIVQFVPFRDVNNSPIILAKEVLEEIPREVANYFKMRNIYPNAALQASEFEFDRSYTVPEQPFVVGPNQPMPQGGYQGPSVIPLSYHNPSSYQNPPNYQNAPTFNHPSNHHNPPHGSVYQTVPLQGYNPQPYNPQNLNYQTFENKPSNNPNVPQGYAYVPPK